MFQTAVGLLLGAFRKLLKLRRLRGFEEARFEGMYDPIGRVRA